MGERKTVLWRRRSSRAVWMHIRTTRRNTVWKLHCLSYSELLLHFHSNIETFSDLASAIYWTQQIPCAMSNEWSSSCSLLMLWVHQNWKTVESYSYFNNIIFRISVNSLRVQIFLPAKLYRHGSQYTVYYLAKMKFNYISGGIVNRTVIYFDKTIWQSVYVHADMRSNQFSLGLNSIWFGVCFGYFGLLIFVQLKCEGMYFST